MSGKFRRLSGGFEESEEEHRVNDAMLQMQTDEINALAAEASPITHQLRAAKLLSEKKKAGDAPKVIVVTTLEQYLDQQRIIPKEDSLFALRDNNNTLIVNTKKEIIGFRDKQNAKYLRDRLSRKYGLETFVTNPTQHT